MEPVKFSEPFFRMFSFGNPSSFATDRFYAAPTALLGNTTLAFWMCQLVRKMAYPIDTTIETEFGR